MEKKINKKIHTNHSLLSTAPPPSEVTIAPQPLRTTTTTTTTTMHRGVANTTTPTGPKEGSKGAVKPHLEVLQTTVPPPLESFPLPERFCEATEKRDILWPQTQRGMLVERPCPKGTRGKQPVYLRASCSCSVFPGRQAGPQENIVFGTYLCCCCIVDDWITFW